MVDDKNSNIVQKKPFSEVVCNSLQNIFEDLQKLYRKKQNTAEVIANASPISTALGSSKIIMDKITTDDYILLAQISNICELAVRTIFSKEETTFMLKVIRQIIVDSARIFVKPAVVVTMALEAVDFLIKDLEAR